MMGQKVKGILEWQLSKIPLHGPRTLATAALTMGHSIGILTLNPLVAFLLEIRGLRVCLQVLGGLHVLPCLLALTFDPNISSEKNIAGGLKMRGLKDAFLRKVYHSTDTPNSHKESKFISDPNLGARSSLERNSPVQAGSTEHVPNALNKDREDDKFDGTQDRQNIHGESTIKSEIQDLTSCKMEDQNNLERNDEPARHCHESDLVCKSDVEDNSVKCSACDLDAVIGDVPTEGDGAFVVGVPKREKSGLEEKCQDTTETIVAGPQLDISPCGKKSKQNRCLQIFVNYQTLAFFVSSFILSLGLYIPFFHLDRYRKDLGISDEDGAQLYVFFGVAGIVGRVTAGVLVDFLGLNSLNVFQLVSYIPSAVNTLCLPLAKSYGAMLSYMIVYGFTDGASVSTFSCVIHDLVGPLHHCRVLGWLFFFYSIPYAISAPFAGFLADATGSYTSSFLLAGACLLLGSMCLNVIRLLNYREKSQLKRIGAAAKRP